MKSPYCIKICSKCNRLLVACSMNFSKQKNGKYGFESKCKECKNKYNKQYDIDHKDHKAEYYQNNKDHKAEYYQENKQHLREYYKHHYQENKEQYIERSKQYYENNKKHKAEYNKQWNEANRKRRNELARKAENKRRALKAQNGGEYTLEQWQECLEFFDYKCAYSGAELNNSNVNVEHVLAISKGGTNNIYNIVPALDTVNFSKNASDMLEWYKQQPYYSEERLNKILDWIEYASNKYELNTISI